MPPVSPTLLGVTLALFGSVCIALQAVCLRFNAREGGSADALMVVFLIDAGAFLLLALGVRTGSTVTVDGIAFFVGAGVVGTLIGGALYFVAIERVGASRSDTIKASQPLHASVLAAVLLGEPLALLTVLGMLLVVAGIGILVTDRPDGEVLGVGARPTVLAYPLGAALFFGVEPTLAKLGFATGMGVLDGLAIKTVTAVLGLVLYLRVVRGAIRPPRISRWTVTAGLVNAVSLLSYYVALQYASVSIVVALFQTSPLLTVSILRVAAPDLEPTGPRLLVAVACVVVGAGIVVVG